MTEREKFEAWMTSEQWFHGSDFDWDEPRNCYAEFGIHLAYKAWQAAAAIKNTLPENIKIYTASPSDMSPPVDDKSFCVDFVLATDYQALKEQMAALAAENAALKESYRIVVEELDVTCVEIGMLRGEMAANFPVPETPATDAFIAYQQAIGVEKFSSDVGLEYQQLEPELKPGSAQAKALKNIVFRSVSFAKKLRDEVKP